MYVSTAKHSIRLKLVNKKSVTTKNVGQLDRRVDVQTNVVQSDPYVSPCFAGDTIIDKESVGKRLKEKKFE